LEDRQYIYENYAVVNKNSDLWGNDFGVFGWLNETAPRLESQSQILGDYKSLQLENYYRQAGADDAAELAAQANLRFWLAKGCIVGGATLFAVGLATDVEQEESPFQQAWAPLGIAAVITAIWLMYDRTENYQYPSADLFNKYLEKKLNLSLYDEKSQTGVMASLKY